jgi:hypothetical protein
VTTHNDDALVERLTRSVCDWLAADEQRWARITDIDDGPLSERLARLVRAVLRALIEEEQP